MSVSSLSAYWAEAVSSLYNNFTPERYMRPFGRVGALDCSGKSLLNQSEEHLPPGYLNYSFGGADRSDKPEICGK